MTKEKPLEEHIDEDEFEGVKPDEDEFKDIEAGEDNLDGIEVDEDEFGDIEPDEEDKSISEQLEKISASDPSGPQKTTIRAVPIEASPVLEKIMEEGDEQNLEMQVEEAPAPESAIEEELDYSGQKKEDNGLYGGGKDLEGGYDPHTRTVRFNEDRASAFDSDGLREVNYVANRIDGTMQKGMKNDYEVRSPGTKTKRFDRDKASAFDSDAPRPYEAE